MDDIICQYKFCSGHGECVISLESNNTTCTCETGWTGPRCEFIISSNTEQLTIGQKLLKEPIWIGMIVMLNLVLFFCVSYAARRKCGKKIAKMIPKRKKPPEISSKEASHSKEETSTTAKDIYSLHIELPRSENSSKSPSSKTPTKFLFEKVVTSAPPTPSVIAEESKEAAVKFFEAYKSTIHFPSRAQAQRLSKSNDSTSIFQDGTRSFTEGVVGSKKKDTAPPMIRSFTISSLQNGEPHIVKQRRKSFHRQTRSFPGSPNMTRNPINMQDKMKIDLRAKTSGKTEHCYPVIRILNVNNHEQGNNSDSETSFDIKAVSKQTNGNKCCDQNPINLAEYARNVGSVDHNYPTMECYQKSQQEENYGLQENVNLKRMEAKERRKLFGDKSKSRSFYDISQRDGQCSAKNSSFSTDTDSTAFGIRRSMPSNLNNFSSFDSGQYCPICQRNQSLDHAESISLESDLNRLYRPQRAYSSGSRTNYRKCNFRKCQKKRRAHCRKHLRQFSKDINSLGMAQCRSNQSRDSTKNLFYTVGAHRSFHWTHSTSTESDVCNCSRNESKARRKCYKRTEQHFSDNLWKIRHKRHDLTSFKNARIAASWDLSQNESYFVNMQPYENRTITAGPQEIYQSLTNSSSSRPNLLPDWYEKQRPSVIINKCHSASAVLVDDLGDNYNINKHKPQNLTDVEIVSPNLCDEENIVGRSFDRPEISSIGKLEATTQSSSSSSKKSKSFKDSAYQTKQSSVDRYSSSKDRNGGTASKNKVCNRNNEGVHHHLHQAAEKLAMIKRLQTAQEQFSKDSAVYTFSEDDISADDQDLKGQKALVKRTSALTFQMKEKNLSQVKEEFSAVSHGSYNTPTNEPATEQADKHDGEQRNVITLTNIYSTETAGTQRLNCTYLEETKV